MSFMFLGGILGLHVNIYHFQIHLRFSTPVGKKNPKFIQIT